MRLYRAPLSALATLRRLFGQSLDYITRGLATRYPVTSTNLQTSDRGPRRRPTNGLSTTISPTTIEPTRPPAAPEASISLFYFVLSF